MALNYSSKHDISYANYNNKTIPWKVNASIISQNNQITDPSLNLGTNNNNLVIESSQNNILFITSENNNKKVIVKNNMTINNLDVSNSLTTKLNDASSITLNNRLYLPARSVNIIGDLKVGGSITIIGSTATGLVKSESQFINVTLSGSRFTDVSIVNSNISYLDFSNVNIINSYIYNIPFGYGFDKSNNSYPNKAIFSDVSLQRLVLDSSLNSYINFAANANSANSIIIRSYDDYSKLVINKPLNIGIGIGETISTISNVSIFYGTISCNTLYYSQLVPDIRLNTYFDISIGQVSVSGNNIPVNNSFNIGSSDYKFNEIISTQFSGDLSGTATSANDLRKNLDMSFNNLDIYGTFTLNRQNLNQFLSGDLISIVAADISFSNANNKVRDLSISLYSKTDVDLCLNSNFTKISLVDASLLELNNRITSISASVYSKSEFDLCLNRNILSANELSAIVAVVTNPTQIYPRLGYIDNSLIKQTNAKVSNELVFPYAITYVDDNVEDTNIKESYSYRQTTTVTTFNTTTTKTTTITYSYETRTRPVSGAEPNNLGEIRLIMNSARGGANDIYRRTWNDVNGVGAGPAVYMTADIYEVKSFSVATTNPTYEYISTSMSWQDHQNAAVSSGRNLAVILNSVQQTIVKNLIPSNTYGTVYIGGRRINNNTNNGTSTEWQWVTGDSWNYTNWNTGEPNGGSSETKLEMVWWENGKWNDTEGGGERTAVYMRTSNNTNNILNLSWEAHRLNAIAVGAELAVITNATENEAVGTAAQNAGLNTVYIGGRRKSNSTNAYGITSADWEWHNGTTWNYSNFFRGGQTEQYEHRIDSQPSESSPVIGQPVQVGSSTTTYANFDVSNVKLPLLVSSSNGSIVATATSVRTLSIPSNPTPINSNSEIISNSDTTNDTRDSSITTNTIIRRYTTTTITYSLNSGLATGSFKISENNNNKSYYIKSSASALPTTIPINYSCIALTDDGMFVALGKANDVTVYMRTSSGWTILGSPISVVNFTAYTNTDCNILWNGFDSSMYKNLQNLAINYISGSNVLDLYLAFGDARSSVKLYSYTYSGTSVLSNGFYTVSTTGTWVTNTSRTRTPNSALGETSNTNFGYFVTLSHNPILLGFTVDDKFYTYNTSTNSLRGSRKTLELPTLYSASTKNIVAFKMSSDADKIIVSNTYYVFIYKWDTSTIDWSLLRTISLLSTTNNPIITFTYGTSSNKIAAAPRSLDIRNISTNECVFAIGFPDVLIDISNNRNRKVRGYVEYWKLINDTLTRLATLEPRKRNIDSSNVDTDEYFFSAGGIKITNANTILVAPNFKFHFNSTNKNYTLDTSNLNWTDHNTKAKLISGREIASIENEADNELVKISARNNVVWIGAMRTAINNPTGITSAEWQWSDLSSTWNYTSFASGQPNSFAEKRIQSLSGTWYDTLETVTSRAVYMTRLQYSLNTFNVFDRFYFHSSGFTSSYANTDISSTVIAKWVRTDSPSTQPIEFRGNGDLKRTSQGIFTVSDIRLKENIVDASPKLEDLLKVRVVNYNLKGSKDAKLIGVVAQELEQLFPTLVKDGELSQHDIYLGKTESYKSVKYSCFDVILIKAFQEQVAIINKLSSQLDEIDSQTKLLKAISQDFVILKQELDLLKQENELFKLNINEILKLI